MKLTYTQKPKNCIKIPKACPWKFTLDQYISLIQWAAEAQCCFLAEFAYLLHWGGCRAWLPSSIMKAIYFDNFLESRRGMGTEIKAARQNVCLVPFLRQPEAQIGISSVFGFQSESIPFSTSHIECVPRTLTYSVMMTSSFTSQLVNSVSYVLAHPPVTE